MFYGWVLERGRLFKANELSVLPGAGKLAQPNLGTTVVIGHSPEFGAELRGVGAGASLSVSGVCLTIVESSPDSSTVELSPETMRSTILGELHHGAEVNLEPARPLGDVPFGHRIRGIVDTVIEVVKRRDLGERHEVSFSLADTYREFVVENGKVAIDGVSLNVESLAEDWFQVELHPNTLQKTTLGSLEVGRRVNLEVNIPDKQRMQTVSSMH